MWSPLPPEGLPRRRYPRRARGSAGRSPRRSPPLANAPLRGARQDEEHVRDPVQPREEVLARKVALVDALYDPPFGTADHGAGLIERGRDRILAGHDEAALDGRAFLDRLEDALELREGGAVDALLEPAEVAAWRRHFGHSEVKPALDVEDLATERRSRVARAGYTQHGLRLIEVPEGFDPRIGLANAILPEERGLARVAGAGRDAR